MTSGIAGAFQRDGQPVSRERLKRLSQSEWWLDGPVGLCGARWQRAGSIGNRSGLTSLTFDGRLDNRPELTAVLGPGSDPELVLLAYEKWDEDCPAHLLGDFAFALWDNTRQRLFCARDYLGVRPFHYYLDNRLFLFCSDVAPLLGEPEVPHRPNEGIIAEYLASSHSTREETLYAGIQRLPPATTLVIEANRTHQRRYWSPPANRHLRYADYPAEFRSLLQTAIDCRQGDSCLMSGGLDSTSVALLAQVPAYSLTFPGRDCDESTYIEGVVRAGHLPSHLLTPTLPNETDLNALVARDRLPPLAPNYTMVEQLCGLVHRDGCRSVLTGQGGDHAMIGSRLYYADLLRRGRVPDLAAALRRDFGSNLSRAWGEFRTSALYPILPPDWMQTLRRIRRGVADAVYPPWLRPGFVSQTGLPERLARSASLVSHLPDLVHREYYRMVTGAEMAYSLESNHRCASSQGVSIGHPFLDRRLIEFAFHIPPEQWLQGDESKGLLRRAMAGTLPDAVRLRQDKAEFSSLLVDTLRVLPSERWLNGSHLAANGWIDLDRLKETHRELTTSDTASLRLLGPLWEACSVEWWLRREFGS